MQSFQDKTEQKKTGFLLKQSRRSIRLKRWFTVSAASSILVLFGLIAYQFASTWKDYNEHLGVSSATESWLNRKLISYKSIDSYDMLLALRRLEAATLRHAGQIEDRQAYWALQAPADLEAQQPPESSSRGRPAERTSFQGESSVRFRPAERMSFQSFLAKVVGTTAEDVHFLLYDKFALRGGNWRNVPAFLEACRGVASGSKLTLIYQPRSRADIEKDGPDPKPCAAQVAHQSCREVFPQAQLPHDRYLFTVSGKEIKAWQLSNSPLAAKADFGAELDADSPLEWPALTVFPVAFADLEAGFQTFLNRA